ncbi:MAG TPA: hypothetical protein VHE30_08640 [Polyangiaceae bacterium]|nr:hypothetical protein [Polyangiaceae bacterium]
MTRSRLIGPGAAALVLLACQRPPAPSPGPTAKFGIFFGGQIEERREIPFELDTAKQTQGFRVEFGGPLPREESVEWTITRPPMPKRRAPRKAQAEPEPPRGPITGMERVRAGESRYERRLDFTPGDPLGLWNVRVVADGRVVLDRPFEVFDAAERARVAVDGGP